MRAEKGAQGLRDRDGAEEVGAWELFSQGVMEPLRCLMLLTLGTVPVAARVIDAVLPPTVLALIEAVSVVSTLAMHHGASGLWVGARQMGVALQVCWSTGPPLSWMVVMAGALAGESECA
jgi:hypothetical protein